MVEVSSEGILKPTTIRNMQERREERDSRLANIEEEIKNQTLTATARKILALERRIEQAQKWSELDEKTGLAKGSIFKREVTSEMTEVNKAPGEKGVMIAIVDVDDFGRFNQKHNELIGDQALKTLSDRLRDAVRTTDTVARLGGEELAVVLPHTLARKEIQIADRINGVERIRKEATEKLAVAGETITVSIGEAVYIPGESYETFYDRASKAETIAKLLGKNRTVAATQVHPDGSIVMHDVTHNTSYVYEEKQVDSETKKYLTQIVTGDSTEPQKQYEIVSIGAAKPTLAQVA